MTGDSRIYGTMTDGRMKRSYFREAARPRSGRNAKRSLTRSIEGRDANAGHMTKDSVMYHSEVDLIGHRPEEKNKFTELARE
jgi:hypothetical protein